MNWIEVKNRMPELGKPVLILTEYGKMATAYCTDHEAITWGWTDWMRVQHSYGSVTHWMELPEKPSCNCGFQHDKNYNL